MSLLASEPKVNGICSCIRRKKGFVLCEHCAINMADRDGGPVTRSSCQAHGSLVTEMLELIQKDMSNYLKSSDFKEILINAVKDATVTQPLRDEITALKQKAVKDKANHNEQYSLPSKIRIFGLVEIKS